MLELYNTISLDKTTTNTEDGVCESKVGEWMNCP